MHPVRRHFDEVAARYDWYKNRRSYYHSALKTLAREAVGGNEGCRVLEAGCGTGDILGSLPVRWAVGVDFSKGMVVRAREKYAPIRNFSFAQAEAERLPFQSTAPVDLIICMDGVEHFHDLAAACREMARVGRPGTRYLISWANPLWEPILHLLETLKLKMPEGPHHWPGEDELVRLFTGAGLEVVERGCRLLVPERVGGFSDWVNGWFYKVPGLRRLGLVRYLILKKL